MRFTLTAAAAVLLVHSALGMPAQNATDRLFSNCRCGQRNRAMRIVGGRDAGEAEFPWQAHVGNMLRGSNSQLFSCGGSIISSRLIVTAAHCFFDQKTHQRLSNKYLVAVGTNDGQWTYKHMDNVQEVTIHPDYDPRNNNGNDIAMVTLKDDLDISHAVSPICLPDAHTNFEGKTGTVSGWGRLSTHGQSPNRLQKVDLTIMSDRACKREWNYYVTFSPSKQVCVDAPRGKDTCMGDSGGPFAVEHRGHYDLVGIVSFGSECGSDAISVFTEVAGFLPWINSFLAGRDGGSTCPK